MSWVDGLGYLASALIVLSLAMRQVVRLRTISLIGSVVFVAYGLMIGAWPVAVSNALIALLNIYYLARELRPTPDAQVTAVAVEPDAPFLRDYLRANAPDIERSQPGWRDQLGAGADPQALVARLVNREGLPAGVIIGEPRGEELRVLLDYVTPAYRDTRTARWVFGPGASTFTDAGFARLVAEARTPQHSAYLQAVGFHAEGGLWVLDLPGEARTR